MKSIGTVYLVGAGPGDAGLLTLRGAELLRRADVVVHDKLVNPALLQLAAPTAEILYRGKRSGDHSVTQAEINELIIAKARAGKCVVRLKGGDPYVFGRGGEEAEALVAAKVPFEVVPGVSSIIAVPAYAGIPLTHRDHCSSFLVLTGQENPERTDPINWAQVAQTPGTKVILMGVERIRSITAELQKHGVAADLPMAMIRWGTTGRQECLEGTVGTMADLVEKSGFTAPALTIIGSVVGLRPQLNWYEHLPLFGRRIVVTRSRDKASALSKPLLERGAEVLEIPTIKLAEPTNRQDLADALLGLNSYDWIIFTSANGVTEFFEYFFKAFDDMRDIGGVRIAAVGPATAAKLKEFHLRVDLMPDDYLAPKVAKALHAYESVENLRILLMRAEKANPELPKLLGEMGGIVDDVACYRTVADTEDTHGAGADLLANGADWITFTSGSTVEHFHARFDLPALAQKFPEMRFASIGPETTKALTALGLTAAVEAKPHTSEALAAAVEKASKVKKTKG